MSLPIVVDKYSYLLDKKLYSFSLALMVGSGWKRLMYKSFIRRGLTCVSARSLVDQYWSGSEPIVLHGIEDYCFARRPVLLRASTSSARCHVLK